MLSDVEKEELRVKLSTLTYELANLKQEREMEAIRYEKETRSLQLKADADFRKAQVGANLSCDRNFQRLTNIVKGSRVRQCARECEDGSISQRVEGNAGAIIE